MKDKDKAKDKVKVSPGKMLVKEVTIGEKITPESIQQDTVQNAVNNAANDKDVQSLSEVQSYSKRTAAGAAAGALCLCGGGVAFRIRRFMKEV